MSLACKDSLPSGAMPIDGSDKIRGQTDKMNAPPYLAEIGLLRQGRDYTRACIRRLLREVPVGPDRPSGRPLGNALCATF
jgi:hypothetical protein